MALLSCKGMTRLVFLSSSLFVLGLSLLVCINLFGVGGDILPSYVPYLAFFFTLLSPVLLLVTVLMTMFPRESKKMQSCEH